MSYRISKSMETVGSPDSILATRDWLDCTAAANIVLRQPLAFVMRLLMSFRQLEAQLDQAASSADRPRNSLASPTFQPRPVSLARLLARIFVFPNAFDSCIDVLGWLASSSRNSSPITIASRFVR